MPGLSPLAVAGAVPDSPWIAFNRAGAPNSNLQCFSPANVAVSGGFLAITTRVETAWCASSDLPRAAFPYTSGYVSMRRFSFLYGVLEFRAKFGGGNGSGAWPAVWMADVSCQASDPTGTDDNCNGQEIDVAEILQSDFSHVNQQIHVDNFKYNDGCKAPASDTSRVFHVYQLVWAPGFLSFKIDGATTCTVVKPYVPSAPMYVKIETFVGSFGGPVNNDSMPWVSLIDYLKVTQGSTVVFDEDFSSASTIEHGPVAFHKAASVSHAPQSGAGNSWSLWVKRGVIIFLLVVGLLITIRTARS